jgi:hypothetical protein
MAFKLFVPFGLNGASGGIRTHDLLIRSQSLYPTELRAHTLGFNQTLNRISGFCWRRNSRQSSYVRLLQLPDRVIFTQAQ